MLAALQEPGRLDEASALVTRAAPALAGVLDAALADGGWFGPAQEEQLRKAALGEDPDARIGAVRTLLAEQTRLGMLVGVTVGIELAAELAQPMDDETTKQEG